MQTCFLFGSEAESTNLQAPAVRWLMLGTAAVPALCPLQGWLQPMTAVPSLLCCVFTPGIWEFLHGLGLWTDVGLSGLGEPSLDEELWRFGTSGENEACAATPVLEFRCPCWPQLGFGGRRVECWDGRPVGLLGGTDRSVCWWWSPGWKASPAQETDIISHQGIWEDWFYIWDIQKTANPEYSKPAEGSKVHTDSQRWHWYQIQKQHSHVLYWKTNPSKHSRDTLFEKSRWP